MKAQSFRRGVNWRDMVARSVNSFLFYPRLESFSRKRQKSKFKNMSLEIIEKDDGNVRELLVETVQNGQEICRFAKLLFTYNDLMII